MLVAPAASVIAIVLFSHVMEPPVLSVQLSGRTVVPDYVGEMLDIHPKMSKTKIHATLFPLLKHTGQVGEVDVSFTGHEDLVSLGQTRANQCAHFLEAKGRRCRNRTLRADGMCWKHHHCT
jgi:hypothetical protein